MPTNQALRENRSAGIFTIVLIVRHVVNISLLITFGALAVTGVMAFVLPFSLTTTQIHIAAGLVTVVLIGFHLAARLPYFKKQISFGSGRESEKHCSAAWPSGLF